MTLSRTPLLLALLPLLATAAPGDERVDDDPQITRLAPVLVTPDADKPRADGIDGWGNAPLRDTPASIRVIGRQQIEDRQIRTLSELAREDASLGDNYAPVGYYQNIAIRGFALDAGTGYRGNNLAMTGEQAIALEDKQQVEVLKGLAGLTAGVMEPGGVVNFVSKRPEAVRALTLGTDSQGSLYTALDVGGWLTPTFGLRANVAWEDMQSYVHHADGRRNFYALAADWKIGPDTTLELDGNYHSSAQRSVSGYQLLGGTALPEDPDPTLMLGYQPWQQPVSIHSANTSARLRHAFNQDWQLRLAAGRSRSVIDDNVAFAYGCWYVDACWSGSPPNYFAPDGSYDIYDYRNPGDTRVGDNARATLEGRFDTGGIGHAVSLGVSAFHRSIDRHRNVNEYVGTGNIAGGEPPAFAPSPEEIGPKVRRLDSWQRSAFLVDRLSLGERWQLIVGGQFARLHERARDKHDVPERETRISKTLPQAALLWKPDAALTAYASYSEGISLGKEAPSWTSNEGEFLDPRLSRQLETGVKYRWNDRLDFDASLFRIRQPYQYAQPDASSAGFTFVQRGEEVHEGLELSANGRLADALGVNASVGLIRARAQGTGIAAYDGNQVVNVPRLRASLHLDYALPALPQLGLQAGWRHASANPATPDGQVRVPAYDVFDAGLRYGGRAGEHDFTVQLGIDNLFDRSYWRDTGSSLGDNYLFPGAPRLARLSVRVGL
ncbi:TonB-dependent siderophore receptor [Thermomonas brevis]|uniref:TonB-dependent siderophore receptor n=1 Tax=Thermomonas brevis TaxID=215691 RepID=A0A7G9QV17_9GAMM|nr:TonB-dependent siderophore receptor [Thermomonas brevis]QNN47192.1 TonB-dependent siderophore receptor [Thermomonas brevis]